MNLHGSSNLIPRHTYSLFLFLSLTLTDTQHTYSTHRCVCVQTVCTSPTVVYGPLPSRLGQDVYKLFLEREKEQSSSSLLESQLYLRFAIQLYNKRSCCDIHKKSRNSTYSTQNLRRKEFKLAKFFNCTSQSHTTVFNNFQEILTFKIQVRR